jgi:hypothetical protein
MMPAENHYVWAWLNDKGEPVYVGRGRIGPRGNHPAAVKLAVRHERESELNLWLRSLSAAPTRSPIVPSMAMSSAGAQAIWSGTRRQLQDRGVRLLSDRYTDRKPETYNAGRKPPRAVIDPRGDLHPSVRAAARDWGLTPAAITLHCQRGKAWRYLDQLENRT